MTNVLLAGFTSHWHHRKSSMRTIPGEKPPALRGCPQLRSVPSLWSGMREQSCSISRGLKINKNSAEGEVFLVDFPSYRIELYGLNLLKQLAEPYRTMVMVAQCTGLLISEILGLQWGDFNFEDHTFLGQRSPSQI